MPRELWSIAQAYGVCRGGGDLEGGEERRDGGEWWE